MQDIHNNARLSSRGDATFQSRHWLWVLVSLICLGFATTASELLAEMLPTLSLRSLSIEADLIVIGEPIEQGAEEVPDRFKVVRVLKGPASLADQEINLRNEGLYSMRPIILSRNQRQQPSPRIQKAILFLNHPPRNATGDGYRTVLSGIRALTADAQVLVPRQTINPGPQYLLPSDEITWNAMLAKVEQDLPRIAEIVELGEIDDLADRNVAIFTWIEAHKNEFGGGRYDEKSKGWASLESRLFDWLMESCIPKDCWKAIKLSTELRAGRNTVAPSFCSPEGRALLIAKTFDQDLPDKLRLRALQELGNGGAYWYAHRDLYPRTSVVGADERRTIIDRIVPLLDHKEPAWRLAAVQCLAAVSRPYDANFEHMLSEAAIPSLVDLYHRERDNEARIAAGEAIRRIGGESLWQQVTGNPDGIVVIVRYAGLKQGVLEFNLNLMHTRTTITEPPVFSFERLNDDGAGAKLSLNPTVTYPKDLFAKGWVDWQGLVVMTVPSAKVAPGRWRLTVEGRTGKQSWRAEAIELTVPAVME